MVAEIAELLVQVFSQFLPIDLEDAGSSKGNSTGVSTCDHCQQATICHSYRIQNCYGYRPCSTTVCRQSATLCPEEQVSLHRNIVESLVYLT